LGRGFNGMVMDVYSSNPSDTQHFVALLEALPSNVSWKIYTTSSKEKHVKSASDKKRILDAMKRHASEYVAKITMSRVSVSQKTVFHNEIKASASIMHAYGPAAAAKHLTLGALPVSKDMHVLAVVVPSRNIYCMFNIRCTKTLDKIDTWSSDAEFKRMVVQLLTSVGILHKNKWLHTDLKPDNFMYCEASKRYKLIDFGGAIQFTSPKQFDSQLTFLTVTRTRSPIAWYVAGANRTMSATMSKMVVALLYRWQFIGSTLLTQAVDDMINGFYKKVSKSSDDDAMRCSMVESMLPCIDTMSLGLALMSIVMQSDNKTEGGLSIPARNRIVKFVTERMLRMDHSRFLGHDASKLAEKAEKELLS